MSLTSILIPAIALTQPSAPSLHPVEFKVRADASKLPVGWLVTCTVEPRMVAMDLSGVQGDHVPERTIEVAPGAKVLQLRSGAQAGLVPQSLSFHFSSPAASATRVPEFERKNQTHIMFAVSVNYQIFDSEGAPVQSAVRTYYARNPESILTFEDVGLAKNGQRNIKVGLVDPKASADHAVRIPKR